MKDIDTPIVRPIMKSLQPYEPGLTIGELARKYGLEAGAIIKLASNENPLGMGDRARDAIRRTAELERYPEYGDLIGAIAAHHKVSPKQVIVGNGSNDILDLIARTYIEPGRSAVLSQYAFIVYDLVTKIAGGESIVIPSHTYNHDLTTMLAAVNPTTRVVWVANPNNPTGTMLGGKDIRELLDKLPPDVLLVLDEAYNDYLSPSVQYDSIVWTKRYVNLLVVRTFSKIHGLAGLRIGYAIANERVIDFLNRTRQPFNVNQVAAQAAIAALEDTNHVQKSYSTNESGRQQLQHGFDSLSLRYLPAHGNFITVNIENALSMYEQLLREGVIVRPLVPYGMQHWLRITIGTASENEGLLRKLQDIMSP